jgi:hypothetical protein
LKKKRSILLAVLLLVAGIWGTVFFFPVHLGESNTCIYHRIVKPADTQHFQAGYTAVEHKDPYQENQVGNTPEQEQLLKDYLFPFGFAWWISLALIAAAGFSLRKSLLHQNGDENN